MTRQQSHRVAFALPFLAVLVAGCAAVPSPSQLRTPPASSAPEVAEPVAPPSFDRSDTPLPDELRPFIERLQEIAGRFPEADGGSYWSPDKRRFAFRVVLGASGAGELRALLEEAIAAEGALAAPVVVEETPVSTARLQAAADRLNADRFWAHPYEDDVHHVVANRLHNMLKISVSAHPDEIAQRAVRATGIDAYAELSGPIVPL